MDPIKSLQFSVVVPLYNHARYIGAALDSVLAQTRPVDQIVLIDDGSSDGGFEIATAVLQGFENKILIQQTNRGAHHTLNRCIELAQASHVAVLNSDDMFLETKIADCESLLANRPDVDLVFGGVDVIDEMGQRVVSGSTVEWLQRAVRFYEQHGLLALSLLNENFAVTTSNMVFSKSLWQRNGGFQPLRYCHDMDFILTACTQGRVLYDRSRHIKYRIHDRNTIKETVAKVRLEVAAVTVAAIDGGNLLSEATQSPAELAALIDHAIARKQMRKVAVPLMALARVQGSRSAFYASVASSEVSKCLTPWLADNDTSAGSAVSSHGESAPSALRVAVEVLSFDKGGLEKVVLDTVVHLRERGVSLVVISQGPVGHLGTVARDHGIEVVQLPKLGRDSFYRSVLKSRSINLSISHFSRAGYHIFAELGIPNITYIHNVYAMLAGEALIGFKTDDEYVSKYIAVSQNAADFVVGKFGIDREKVVVVPNGLILSEHEQRVANAPAIDRKQFGLSETDYVFLNVASYNLHKAHYLMADAMSRILESRDDIKILCVGNEVYPPHVEQLRQHLIAEGLDRHVLLPGYFVDVTPLHAMSDAFLLPSFIEGWSIAMTEAMFCGKPMILSDTGGSRDVIQGEDIGIVIPNEYGDALNLDSALLDALAYEPRRYDTAPALAAAMMRFADERARWKEAGRLGRLKVLRSYDFDTIADRYLRIMEDVARPAVSHAATAPVAGPAAALTPVSQEHH